MKVVVCWVGTLLQDRCFFVLLYFYVGVFLFYNNVRYMHVLMQRLEYQYIPISKKLQVCANFPGGGKT
jgi:hypothetical protein